MERKRWIATAAATLAMLLAAPAASASAARLSPVEPAERVTTAQARNAECPPRFSGATHTLLNFKALLHRKSRVVDAPSNTVGAHVYMNAPHGGPNQKWCWWPVPLGGGNPQPAWVMASVSAWTQTRQSLCLEAKESDKKPGTADEGAPVRLAKCNGNDGQIWRQLSNAGGGFAFQSFLGKCLDVRFGSTDVGMTNHVFTCHGAANQGWLA